MAEELTRKLLKVFGMAVTDFEVQCQGIAQQAQDAANRGDDPMAFLPLLEGLARSTSQVTGRLLEVTQFIAEQQARVTAELLGLLEEMKKRKGSST